ncbi:CPBP family intramembrane glutamic endopeptidase [Enterococcus crotali]|uniref:CPBP family intramembrane glutamic endopeptidase n=1 Tax=Enterococcus crotali TaxID=1453587 RepID=UPI0004702CF2|nr:CPBP family intramembrane glutamic endopeptidase [Enterococcus crotali]
MKKEELKRGWRIIITMIYALLSMAISLCIPLGIAFAFFGRSGMNETVSDVTNMLMGFIGAPIMILLTKRYYQKHFLSSIETFDFGERDSIRKIGLGFLMGALMIVALFGILWLLGADIQFYDFNINWFSILSGVSTFFGMAVVEECIFRGLLPAAFSFLGSKVAIIVPAGLFVAMHMDLWRNLEVFRIIDLFIAGILFMLIFRQTKSLVFVSAFHAANNVTAMLLGIEMDNGFLKTSLNHPPLGLTVDQFLAICSAGISIVLIVWLYFKKKPVRIA